MKYPTIGTPDPLKKQAYFKKQVKNQAFFTAPTVGMVKMRGYIFTQRERKLLQNISKKSSKM